MLRRLRGRFFTILNRAGISDRVADSRWRARRLLILCYHGISLADEHEWNNQLYISPALLRARFEALKRGRYRVLPLDEALNRLAAGTLPARSVAVTFDDGASDFHARALPLLRECGYPATVYQTTYYSEYQRPVFDTATGYLLWRAWNKHAAVGSAAAVGSDFPARRSLGEGGSRISHRLEQLIPGLTPLDLSTERARRAAALRIRDYANGARLSAEEKDQLLRRIAAAVDLDYDATFSSRALGLMTADEIRHVAASGIDVQLHTHRHRTPADRAAFLREIDDNRIALARILGPGPRTHFCYPSGIYEPPFPGWLREAGVRSATTCDFRLASAADDMLLLPRLVDTGNISPVEFDACLAGVADMFPHRRRARTPARTGVGRRASARLVRNGA